MESEMVADEALPAAGGGQWYDFLNYSFLGQECWRYAVLLGIIAAGLIAGLVIDHIFKNFLEKLTKKTRFKLDELVVAALRWPAKLVAYTIAVRGGSMIFTFPDPQFQQDFRAFFENATWVLIGIVIAVVVLKVIDIVVEYLKPRVATTDSQLDDQLLPLVAKLVKIFSIVIVGLLILQNLGYNVTSLIAGLGIGGLAIALAAKDTLENIFGSITIFADKPFSIGDRVQVDGYDGPVESVGLRSTRVRTLDGTLVTIPNAKMATSTINNVQARPAIKKLFQVNLTYDTGFEKMSRALDILREIYGAEKDFENFWVYFSDFAAHSLDILCIIWCKELRYEEYLKIMERVNLEMLRRFDEEGIEFAFPTQTVYHKSGDLDLHAAMAPPAPRGPSKVSKPAKKAPKKKSK